MKLEVTGSTMWRRMRAAVLLPDWGPPSRARTGNSPGAGPRRAVRSQSRQRWKSLSVAGFRRVRSCFEFGGEGAGGRRDVAGGEEDVVRELGEWQQVVAAGEAVAGAFADAPVVGVDVEDVAVLVVEIEDDAGGVR